MTERDLNIEIEYIGYEDGIPMYKIHDKRHPDDFDKDKLNRIKNSLIRFMIKNKIDYLTFHKLE